MKKNMTLDEILAGIMSGPTEEPIFNDGDNLKEKNDLTITAKFSEDALEQLKVRNPEHYEQASQITTLEGNLAVIVILGNNGKVTSGIVGSMSHPMDAMVLMESLDEAKDNVAKQGANFITRNMK